MLAVLQPVDGGRPIRIEKDMTVIGRRQFICDVYFDDAKISKLHCVLYRLDHGWYVRDLGSTNGTRINGTRVTESTVFDSDEIAFEKYRYILRTADCEPLSQLKDSTDSAELSSLLERSDPGDRSSSVDEDDIESGEPADSTPPVGDYRVTLDASRDDWGGDDPERSSDENVGRTSDSLSMSDSGEIT